MPFIGNKPSAVPLTSADIADGIITTAKIADGNITSTKILDGTIATADLNTGLTVNLGAGAVGTPTLTTSGDTNTGIYFPAADTIAFTEGGAEAMRINSSGRVEISNKLLITTAEVEGRLNVQAVDNIGIYIRHGDTNAGIKLASQNNTMTAMSFHTNYGAIGTITCGSSTAYNTSSDYRLKENVNYNFDGTTRLKQLKPARFNFIANSNKTVDGFLAHEVSEIVPEAITGVKDATETKEKIVLNSYGYVIAENIEQANWEAGKIADENGNTRYPADSTWEASKVVPIYQGIDQAKLVPILTKTLQEAIAKIESLEARLTVLENI